MSKKQKFKLPRLSLEHLYRLTDDTGIIQHAKHIIPDRKSGYCTDDNARALVFISKFLQYYPDDKDAKRLFDTYLAFIYYALKPDKTVHNFLDYNRNWIAGNCEYDTLGRVIWALGTIIANPPDSYSNTSILKEFYCDTTNHIKVLSLRGTGYAIFGISEYLEKFSDDSQSVKLLIEAADKLVDNYNHCSYQDWQWFENSLSYGNAVMPAALYAAARITRNDKYLSIAEITSNFLLEHTFNGKYFSFIGSNGWFPKDKQRAQFDQQPIEAAYTVIMLTNAYRATKNKKYLLLKRKAFNWFLGENDLGIALYDPKTSGCCDGLGPDGVNINQGAESLISFLLARIFLLEDKK